MPLPFPAPKAACSEGCSVPWWFHLTVILEMIPDQDRKGSFIPFYIYKVFHCAATLQTVCLLFSYIQLFATPWIAAYQASPSFTISWSLLKFMSIESVMPSNHLILCCPSFSCPQSFPASGSFPISQLFASDAQSTRASASSSLLPMNIQDCFPLGWTNLISFNSQESSPAPQFKSTNSWALSLLYGPTLTSVHDYWKSHSFD